MLERVPFVDLRGQYLEIKDEVARAVEGVLDSGQFVLGREVELLEREFAEAHGCAHGVALNSGTSALHLALLAAGVGPGDEVITVPFTFVATVAAICYAGARAVLVDVEPGTYTMDPARLEEAITPRTRAIIPVHLYGQAADMDAVLEVARRHDLVVIEDACQAHFAEHRGRRVGGMGHAGCFSFYPGKNLGAYGEGGMLVTNDPDLAREAAVLRDWGQERKYEHRTLGFNYRMDGIQGAILRVKLRRLDAWTELRRRNAGIYDELLADGPVAAPAVPEHNRHVYHLYVVRVWDRDGLRAALEQEGISTGIHYPIPVHLQEGYRFLGYEAGAFPVSEAAAREVLSLPMYPELPRPAIERVVERLQALAEPIGTS